MTRPQAARNLTLLASAVLLPGAATLHASEYPKPVQELISQGVDVEAQFEAPGGLRGFAGRANGEPIALYLTPDGKHVLVGALLDEKGANLTVTHLKRYLPEPEFGEAWPLLEQAHWVREGSPNAKRIVYVFTDPECPYCKMFWQSAQPYLGSDVQLRHVMVAILKPTSMGKAARILAAENPSRALAEHEMFGSTPLASIPEDVRRRIEANNALMRRLNVDATPAVFYKDRAGKVRRELGAPPPELLESEIFQRPARN